MSRTIDWEKHKYGEPVACIFRPRQQFKVNPVKPELAKLAGQRLRLNALWLMDEQDKYPGEWALGSNKGHEDVLPGVIWIASGDVTPC